jgi:putative membrane protein
MSAQQFLFSAWTWHPVVLLTGAAALGLYVGVFRVQARIGWFVGALVAFVLTLMSPLDALADGYLFSAHMIQHIVLLLVVPALVFLGLPRSLPLRFRPRSLAHPLVGWAGGVGAMWFWHAPALCDAAVSFELVRALQVFSLLVLGSMFWRPILAPREAERLPPPAAVLYLFSACVACSALGMIITLSPVTVCSVYTLQTFDRLGVLATIRGSWGITPEKDQQIGGLLMWVPMCLIYLGAVVVQITRWFAEPVSASPATEEV